MRPHKTKNLLSGFQFFMLTQGPPIIFCFPFQNFILTHFHYFVKTTYSQEHSLPVTLACESEQFLARSFFLFNYLNNIFYLFCIPTSLYSLLSPPLSPSTQLPNLCSSISIQKETDFPWAYTKHGTELLHVCCAQTFTEKILLVVDGN